jgi:hypothetical protein
MTDPVTKVAQDLSAIEELVVDLAEQAIHDANDHTLPGGDALAARAPVASPEAWQNVYEAAEERGLDLTHVLDEDDADEPPLQTLLFWSEQWRVEREAPFEVEPHRPYPTIETEANFIRWCLPWAWENEVHFEDFADDVRNVRARLEAILTAGRRNLRGVQCFDCGTDLVRQSHDPKDVRACEGHDGVCFIPHAACPHDRGGLRDWWKCPGCDRTYPLKDYARAVSHAHYAFADYLLLDDAAARTGAKPGTIKVWATRGQVRKKRDRDTGRMTYCVPDIEARRADADEVA